MCLATHIRVEIKTSDRSRLDSSFLKDGVGETRNDYRETLTGYAY